ncbi:MAG: hypothetical protein LCI00_10030 [Chloroflexi bacterium]|nr:hypothetical protein [Chloroflexota bacterium]MCC6892935.1 hypothetical protein [Anaerolineae bacterium]
MSEYQYYEFQALDHPLTPEAQAEIQRLSSRVQLTATRASFVYNYSNFPGDPYRVLVKYFDAMLYITNWGTRQLMFRFPANTIPADVITAYQYVGSMDWSTAGKYIVLNIEFNPEDGGDGEWVEGQGILPGVVQLRHDIMHGDYRPLYLAWLKFAHYELDILEEDEDLTEPPVPPNLQSLSPTLRNFMDFFDIDPDWVAAAAQTSSETEKIDVNLSSSIDRLSESEKHEFLERLLNGEPNLDIALTNRLREISGTGKVEWPMSERRTIRQILAASEIIGQKRLEIETQKAESVRLKKLKNIAKQQEQLWARIPTLIEQKKASTYDEALTILKDLRDLADHEQRMTEFQDKLEAIRSQYPRSQGLNRRLQEAKLV